jgi:hypothetical protein
MWVGRREYSTPKKSVALDPHLPLASFLSFSVFLVLPVELTDRREGRGWEGANLIPRRESLVLYQ